MSKKRKPKATESPALVRRRLRFEREQSRLGNGSENDWIVVRGKLVNGVASHSGRERKGKGTGYSSLPVLQTDVALKDTAEGQAFIADFLKRLAAANAAANSLATSLERLTDRYIADCKKEVERFVIRQQVGESK